MHIAKTNIFLEKKATTSSKTDGSTDTTTLEPVGKEAPNLSNTGESEDVGSVEATEKALTSFSKIDESEDTETSAAD
ncbi:unnamed protein product, partial [Rotaria sp. Silwood1]